MRKEVKNDYTKRLFVRSLAREEGTCCAGGIKLGKKENKTADILLSNLEIFFFSSLGIMNEYFISVHLPQTLYLYNSVWICVQISLVDRLAFIRLGQ